MQQVTKIVSKVLVYDANPTALGALKTVCEQNNLIGLKNTSRNIGTILKSNLDLGAIFVAEDEDGKRLTGKQLCHHIYQARPGLPVFLRRDHTDDISDLEPEIQAVVSGCYRTGDMEKLQSLLEEYLFSMYYPVDFAHGVQTISAEVIPQVIKGVSVVTETPYLVKDQIIHGELFSLIPLEGSWCRGYMMLQTNQDKLVEAMFESTTPAADFRDGNGILNELTNMMWGGLRSRYFVDDSSVQNNPTQVPIVVDHLHKFISFGSTEPQLCFKYIVQDALGNREPFDIYQRLIFNLNWSPEQFENNDPAVDALVDSGELEFF